MVTRVNFCGLRQLLKRFDEDGYYVKGKNWEIARGGYDREFEISWQGTPVVECISGCLKNCGLNKTCFKTIKKIIFEEYKELKPNRNEVVHELERLLSNIVTDDYSSNLAYVMLEPVCDDLVEAAGRDWNYSDLKLAIGRVISKRFGISC